MALKKYTKKRQVRVGITWRRLALQPTLFRPGVRPERDPPHTKRGPPVKGVSMHAMLFATKWRVRYFSNTLHTT